MSIVARGNVRQRPYGRLIYALASQGFCGRLGLTMADRRFAVRFNGGQIVDAESSDLADSIIKVAARTGLASGSQLSQVLQERKRRPGVSDLELLIEVASLSPDQVRKLEIRRVAQAAARTFALPDAHFECDAQAATNDRGVITVEWVIFQGLRQHYSEARLVAELGALSDVRFSLRDDAGTRLGAFAFPAEVSPLLERLRGPATAARELVQARVLERQLLLAVLYALWATDCFALEEQAARPTRTAKTVPLESAAAEAVAIARASAVPPSAAEAPSPASRPAVAIRTTGPLPDPAAPIAVPRTSTQPLVASSSTTRPPRSPSRDAQLEALIAAKLAQVDGGLDHFELLGVTRGASHGELQRAYFDLTRKLHPDRLRGMGVSVSTGDAQRLFARINEAFTVLSNPGKRSRYLEVLAAGGELAYRRKQDEAERQAAAILAAEEHFLAGLMALRRNHFSVAREQFTKAVDLNPEEGEHVAYLGWTVWLSADDKDQAFADVRSRLERAIELAPKCAPAYFFLGQLAKHRSEHQQAMEHFQTTLRLAPEHNDAQVEIRLLRSRGLA